MTDRKVLLQIVSDNEQDRAECLAWWREHDLAAKKLVWQKIQAEYADPAMDVMSRFAQLAFSEMLENELKLDDGDGSG